MKTLIKNGRVVDPSQNLDAVMDVLIEDGVVAAIGKNIEADADEVYDASVFALPISFPSVGEQFLSV